MKTKIAGYNVNLPKHPILRMALGIVLIIGGFLGFLPILGFWMIPVGLAVLATDVPVVRRIHRRMTIRLGYWLHRGFPRFARHFGYGTPRSGKHD